MHFAAILHDRSSGSSSPVTVHAQPGVLFIALDNGLLLDWTLADIDSARALDDGPVILQNGRQFLEVGDPAFRQALERSFPRNRLFRRAFFDRIGLAGCLISLFLIVIPVCGSYFLLLPFLAERAAQKVTPDVEKRIGEAWFRAVTAGYPVDSARTRIVQQFYDALAYESAGDMKVTVVREPVANAFAIPGGHIVVFDSIIGIMDAPEQLAALLAHEASHIRWKHSTRALYRNLGNSLFFNLILGSYGDIPTIVAQHGEQLAGLSYSRALEIEADEKGIDLMTLSRIPPRGMPDLFRRMKAAAKAETPAPTFLSTHPAIDERIKIAEDRIGTMTNLPTGVSPELRQIWEELKR